MSDESKERYVKVHTVENRFEADQIEDALKKEGIPCWIKSYMDTAYDGIYVARRGWGAVWVPEELEQQSREIIMDFLEAVESDASGEDGD